MAEQPDPTCPLCHSTRFRVMFEEEFRILLCRNCGLIFMDQQKRNYKAYYSEAYNYKLTEDGCFTAESKLDQSVFNWVIQHLPSTRDLALLEIGCNAGFLLKRFKEYGFQAHGIEPGQKAVTFARQVNGLQVECCMLEDFEPTEQTYDTVLMIQTLEHLPDPLSSLQKVRTLLKEEGLLFVEVPNYYTLHGFYSFKARGKYIPSPNHLFVYSPKTLRTLLRKADFSIQATSYTLLNLRVVAKKRATKQLVEVESYPKVLLYFYLLPFLLKAADLLRLLKNKRLKPWRCLTL